MFNGEYGLFVKYLKKKTVVQSSGITYLWIDVACLIIMDSTTDVIPMFAIT